MTELQAKRNYHVLEERKALVLRTHDVEEDDEVHEKHRPHGVDLVSPNTCEDVV